MQMLSKELVSSEYVESLRVDLDATTVCRFLIAYISESGLNSIGLSPLIKALQDERSFGVSSLTCACGFDPLLTLQAPLNGLRLKYFMDPLVSDPDGPRDLELLHSKLVYLYLAAQNKSVVYMGSHNWSSRALGPGSPRNAEASFRFETTFAPEHLTGGGNSLPSLANLHLLEAWDLPACIPATAANRPIFQQWYSKGCLRAPTTDVDDTIIILSVRRSSVGIPTPTDWEALEGQGIYMQALVEDEGRLVWRSNSRILVFVWESEAALAQGQQPIVLKCRLTTNNAGPDSAERGTNKSSAPISGFRAVIWDPVQLSTLRNAPWNRRTAVQLWSGRRAETFDFQFPIDKFQSSDYDGAARPKYQFYLEVEHVAFPADGPRPRRPRLVWEAESFAVMESKTAAKVEQAPGFYVEPRLEHKIMKCYTELFKLDTQRAKVLPYSDAKQSVKIGKRISTHPLHDTYIGEKLSQAPDEFYSKSEPGYLVPNLEAPDEAATFARPLPRVLKVFATPWKDLHPRWAELARRYSRHSG